MRRRININIDDDISDIDAIMRVLSVMGEGRVSNFNTQYCYATTFTNGQIVYAGRTRAGNDSFTVGEDPSYKGEAE